MKRTCLGMMVDAPVLTLDMVVCPALSLASMSIMLSQGSILCTQRLCFGVGWSLYYYILYSFDLKREIFRKTLLNNHCKERTGRDFTDTVFFNVRYMPLNQNLLRCVPQSSSGTCCLGDLSNPLFCLSHTSISR